MSSSSATDFSIGVFFVYGLFILVLLLASIFWIVELIDAARREFPDPNSKIIWILLIVFLHGLGALIYYFVGKPQGSLPGQGRGSYSPPPSQGAWPPPPSAWHPPSDSGPPPPAA